MGVPVELYAEILDRARGRGKITAIDATGVALRTGLTVRPTFMKPNTAEMRELFEASTISVLAAHDAFNAGYLKSLLERRPAVECLRLALAAAASDACTLRPGWIDVSQVVSLAAEVEPRFTPAASAE